MWIEKTHGNDKYIELFLSWYPSAKIIHIIRDPYDNFSSYRKKTEKQGAVVDAVSYCAEWTLSIDRVLKSYKKYFNLSWCLSAFIGFIGLEKMFKHSFYVRLM